MSENNEPFIEVLKGNGDINFVLIHNAGGNHLFFTHQVETLKKYGNVIWLDLPGHGKSPSISSYTMDSLTRVIEDVCNKFSLTNICLVGLNNGAGIVINTVLSNKVPIDSIVLIDPPIFLDDTFVDEINTFIGKLEEPDFPKFIDALVNNLFIETSSENKSMAKDAFLKVNRQALQATFKGILDWDRKLAKGVLENIRCPSLWILTDEHHCTYDRIKLEAPHFEIGKVVGSKCWATLEVPDQVNAMILRFIASFPVQ